MSNLDRAEWPATDFGEQSVRCQAILATRHAGRACAEGFRLLGLENDERDQIVVSKPEEEEIAEFEARA
ncbi:hypothetical protein DM194_15200 (plasmid) [Azospirillum ramasamyi]|uniref:Uncharacterized protein n=1 Tax=Azospirillum ramasamyi TaxID=682998 RepID=A0A2U9SBI2_9PROT|nr:hypothetical protein DM194_15200 [Azospirillum ramasamyi]